jgi:hypothetical protein
MNVSNEIDKGGLAVNPDTAALLLEVGAGDRDLPLQPLGVLLAHELRKLVDGNARNPRCEACLGLQPAISEYSDPAGCGLVGHHLGEMVAIVISIEEGLSAGSTQDYVVQVVRFAHAWGEDRLFPGATPKHWGREPIYLTLYREKLSAGRGGSS